MAVNGSTGIIRLVSSCRTGIIDPCKAAAVTSNKDLAESQPGLTGSLHEDDAFGC